MFGQAHFQKAREYIYLWGEYRPMFRAGYVQA
jgi:hypothetical protein